MTTLIIESGPGYAWPDEITGCTDFEPEIVANVRSSSSQFNGAVQSIEVPGARYFVTCRWNVLAGEEANAMSVLIHRIRGGAKRVLVPWFSRRAPLGTLRGAPTVNAAGTSGYTLALNNCTLGGTLKRGDMLGLETGQVAQVAEDVTAYASSMIVRVALPIRSIPPNGSVVEWDDPKLLMMSASPRNKFAAMSGNQMKNVELSFVEVFG